jgi:hypothetical protein
MPITDSTTTLDTAWTENDIPIPAFTAGAMSTLSACVDEVGVKLQRGALASTSTPSDAQVKNWLIRAKLKLMQVRDFSYARKYAYVSTVAAQYRYIMPPDFQGGYVSIRDTTSNYKLRQWPAAWADKSYPDPSEESGDEPLVFTVKNMELWLYPPPSDVRTLQMEYSRSGAETTAGDMSWLPEYERFLCCDFAVAQAFESLHMWQEADRYNARWSEELGFSVRADGRRRWKVGQMKCIDVFQEFSARNNQQS